VGFCTGLFAATAITSAPSLHALIPIAVQTVLVAFRTGLCVDAMAKQLQTVGDEQESWTYVMPELTELRANELLAEFQATEVSF
jgi:hypothetical protein